MKSSIALLVVSAAVGSFIGASVTPRAPSPALADSSTSSTVEGVVVPDNTHDGQPFSFSVTSASTPEPVDISTVSGEVVETSKTDKYGRIFLPAGLAAGAYIISSHGGQSSHEVGRIEIQPKPVNPPPQQPQPPSQPQPQPPKPPQIRLTNPPSVLKLNDSATSTLDGHGFNPDFSKTGVTLRSAGSTDQVVVLAATEDQLKLAPPPQLGPGPAQLRVTNTATGETTAPQILLLYSIDGRLDKQRLTSGVDRTQLIIDVKPQQLPLSVRVQVLSGPIDFGNGDKTAETLTENGRAVFPVVAEHGSGAFNIQWSIVPNPQMTTHMDCECSLKTGRCVPRVGYYCIEALGKNGKWSCMSTSY